MTKIILTIALFFIAIIAFSQNEPKDDFNIKRYNITVTVPSITNSKGKVFYGLHNKDTFLKKPITQLNSAIINGKATVTFKDMPVGTYAVICYHDSNDNNKMDFDSMRMPLEDYGSTNNPMNFGPPQFEASKFELIDKDLTFEIKF